MNNRATPVTKDSANESRLCVSIELSRKTWKLGFSDGKVTRARIRSIEAKDWQAFRVEIEKAKRQFGLEAATTGGSRYEAGREGFWGHRALTEKGIENILGKAASLEVNLGKRRKTVRNSRERRRGQSRP